MTASSTKMPTLFIPHGGGPCFFMDWTLMGGPVDTWDK
ncbi:MAG TPA: dioxygenase, partial [Hyphomonas sp.]|nr:dioxygenase [Hyphomonas sp.]